MSRSPLTLAAAAAAALGDVAVVRVAPLGSVGSGGRVDAALIDADDGRRFVARAGADPDSDSEVRAQSRVLDALTEGVRTLLPFTAPRVRGRAMLTDATVVVTDFIPGYAVAAEDVPPGPGIAQEIGRALAAVHELPVSFLREASLPVRAAEGVRTDVARLVERAEASGMVPPELIARWRDAVADDAAWRFHATLVIGDVDAEVFRFQDEGGVARLTGLVGWGSLAAGDPASDLRWTARAPAAAADVIAAYERAAHRAPDPFLASRARLHAELDFATWLLHGIDRGDETVVADAVASLTSLADSAEPQYRIVSPSDDGIPAALAAAGRVPASVPMAADISMRTDTYDPTVLAGHMADRADRPDAGPGGIPTLPVDLSEWTATIDSDDDSEDDAETTRASQAALRRWADGR